MTDYYARRDYVYSSGNRYFSVPFSYIDKEHIHVFINEEETENFTFLNDSQISITPTLTAGDVVSVRRYTPIDERMVVFSNTSILSKEVQNLDSTQLFDAVQEMYDNNTAFQISIDEQFEDYKDEVDDEIADFESAVADSITAFESDIDSAVSSQNDAISAIATDVATANTNASAAVSTANSAETKADSAVSTANTANTNASAAVSTANTASTNASTALSTANSAASTADNAATTATYASDKVDEFGESIEAVIDAAEQIEELQQAIEETQQAAEDAQAAAAQAESAAAELVIDQTFDGTSTHAQSGVAIAGAGFLSGITDTLVVNALGYTPYNGATNPNNYISGITSSDVLTALGYTPVNKTGDTMTGQLRIKYSDVDLSSTPSSAIYRGFEQQDANNNRIGTVEVFHKTDGSYGVNLGAKQYGQANYNTLEVGCDVNGNFFTKVNTPATNSNDYNIANTAWVRARINAAFSYNSNTGTLTLGL